MIINVQNWRSTAPWRNVFLVLLEKNSHQHGWVSASHSWQFCDLCLTTISWDRLQELLFSPRRTRIQLGLTTKAATKPASYVGAVCWASKVSTATSTRRTTCVAKGVSRWQSASLETLASQKVYKRIQDKRYRKGTEGKSSKERVSLKQEGMSCKYSLTRIDNEHCYAAASSIPFRESALSFRVDCRSSILSCNHMTKAAIKYTGEYLWEYHIQIGLEDSYIKPFYMHFHIP